MNPVLMKYDAAVDRLRNKLNLSITPVPGFIVGLSGTDSLVTFDMLFWAMKAQGMSHRLIGVNYVKDESKPGWFAREVVPYMRDYYPEARIRVAEPLGGYYDHQRWADLMLRSTHKSVAGGNWIPHEPGENYWVSGTINATESALGKYSQMQHVASIQPIKTFWKTEILEICNNFGFPQIAIENSRLPDCLCGRDDLAAANIDLIDKILRFENTSEYPKELVEEITDWVRTTKKANSFRQRVPYNI